MKITICLLLGYLLGTVSPAALISHIKHKSLREHGTGNLGASNTLLVFGKGLGAVVMLLDICKGFLAFWLAARLEPDVAWLPMASGLLAVVGHCFPFYLRFKGGKGLAAFAGVVLAYDAKLFLFLLLSGMALMLLVNHSFVLPFYASLFFFAAVVLRVESLAVSLSAAALSLLIVVMHFGNCIKAFRGQDLNLRVYIKTKLFQKSTSD